MNQSWMSSDTFRVLLVDDERSQMELARLNLEKSDPSFKMTTTLTPFDALRLLSEQVFDCVVSDYQMPTLSGVQLCAEIRKTSTIPSILYTGRGSEEVASAAFSAGVDDHVRKEKEVSHYQVLARRNRHAVEKRRGEAALRSSKD